MEYPIVGIVARRGYGKTLLLTKLADMYHRAGVPIFANFSLDIPHYEIDFNEIATFPPYLHDCVLLIDEAHVGTDAYNFWSKIVKDITDFITQTRKLHITLYYSTQVFTQVAKRLRDQTDYIFECEHAYSYNGLRKPDYFRVNIYDKFTDEYIKTFEYNGRPYYNKYNTDELILKDREAEAPEDYGKEKKKNLKIINKST
jgi:hypothetical protein